MTKNEGKQKPKPKKGKSKSKEIVKAKSSDSQSEHLEHKRKKSSRKGTMKEQQYQIQPLPYELTHEAGVYTVKMHQTYTVNESHKLYKSIENLFALFMQKQKRRNKKVHTHIPISCFPIFQFILKEEEPTHDKCSICQFEYQDAQEYEEQLMRESDEDIISLSCSHLLHKGCFYNFKGTKDWIKCPVCSSIFGEMVGDQPPGNMTWNVSSFMHCDGFQDVGTIQINYSMHAGKRGAVSFPGTHRTAYLPDNQKGNQVLQLLKKGFDRKLIFTVGRSVTTGRDNQIVWNGIHHKTNTSGGSSHFGYPDQTYFDRVKLQLAAKGVV